MKGLYRGLGCSFEGFRVNGFMRFMVYGSGVRV